MYQDRGFVGHVDAGARGSPADLWPSRPVRLRVRRLAMRVPPSHCHDVTGTIRVHVVRTAEHEAGGA